LEVRENEIALCALSLWGREKRGLIEETTLRRLKQGL
jgi:hypothetical protein